MPMYVCYQGAVENIPQDEPGCFVITDHQDRTWFCRQIVADAHANPDFISEMLKVGYLAHKLGIAEGAQFCHGTFADQDELQDHLGGL